MSKKIDQDDVLARLKESAAKTNAPKLDESVLLRAVSKPSKFGPGPLMAPKLFVNLVGGAAVLAGLFAFSASINTAKPGNLADLKMSSDTSGSALLAMGEVRFTEADLLARNGKTLAEYGQAMVGNYVSNHPTAYLDEIWPGFESSEQASTWIFLVTDSVYLPNDSTADLIYLISGAQNSSKFTDQISSSSEAEGIRLLIQGPDQKLHPLVVPPNYNLGSLYLALRDSLLGQTYTKVLY